MLLGRLAAPVNDVTVVALSAWADSERIPDAANNPLANTLKWPKSAELNASGVRIYSSLSDGMDATAKALRFRRYRPIVDALRAGNSLTAIYEAVNASTWCSGCPQKRYPATLAALIDGATIGDLAATGTPEPTGRGAHVGSDDPSPQMHTLAAAWVDSTQKLDNIITALSRM